MPRNLVIFMLAAAAAVAQTPLQKTPVAVPAKAAASSAVRGKSKNKLVPPSAPVITIRGLCDSKEQNKQAGACATVLTRRQFEDLVNVLSATTRGIPPVLYRNVAEGYAYLLINAEAGQKAGVNKDPRFDQVMEMTRLRTLGDMYRVQKDKEARQVSPEQIDAYYRKNIANFDEVGLHRLILPRNNPANLNDLDFRAKATRLAGELRERAVKGEDMEKLQKEGLQALGIKDLPPVFAISARKGQLEAKAEDAVFALKQGEVTPVLETTALHTFFKRDSRGILPLEVVKDEIATKLYHERMDAFERTLTESAHAEYSEAYFGPASPKAASQKSANPAEVGPTAAVITIHGLCDGREPHNEDSNASSCTTLVTKEQFETLLHMLKATSFNPALAQPRSVGESYVDLLTYGFAAEKAGTEKDPRFEQVLQLARKRALSDMYRLQRDETAHQVSDEEMGAYYNKNFANFEELTVRHISIPRDNPSKDPDFRAKATRLAGQVRERAAHDEDMDKLQQEAYRILGLDDPPPSLMKPLRRGSMEEKTEQEVFALKPGQVTAVVEIPSAYVIYRLESRRTIPLQEAKAEISQTLYRQRLEELTKALFESVHADYNEGYFASRAPSAWASARSQTSASLKPVSAK